MNTSYQTVLQRPTSQTAVLLPQPLNPALPTARFLTHFELAILYFTLNCFEVVFRASASFVFSV